MAALGLAVVAASSATAARGGKSVRQASAPRAANAVTLSTSYAAVSPSAGTFTVVLSNKVTTGLPKTITPGYHTFVVQQKGSVARDLNVVRLANGYTAAQFQKDIGKLFGNKVDKAAYKRIITNSVLTGGLATVPSNTIGRSFTIKLVPGTYVFGNSDDNGNGPDIRTVVTVTGSATGKQPAYTATIALKEFQFKLFGLKAGTQTVRIKNIGTQLHEVGIGRITDPAKSEQDAVDAVLSDGPPPAWLQFVGFGGLHTPKDEMFVKLHLSKGGRYIFFCFMPDPASGMPHILKGMHRLLTAR
jgi:hypothetical protein